MARSTAALTLAAALLLTAPAQADTYLLDNARHHIGDGLFAPWSADAKRLKLQSMGAKYAIAFCLTKPSRLQVVMAQVLGVEQTEAGARWLTVPLSMGASLPYVVARESCCGAQVALRPLTEEGLEAPVELGRLRPKHNHQGFSSDWTSLLAGGPYILTIESQPVPHTVPGDLDDIEFIGLGVATEEDEAAVWPMGRALIYRQRVPLDAIPPLPCPP
jgi:hypothetical protein